MTPIYADGVRPGDLIMWAGRVAEVVEVRPSHAASTYSRSGRYLLLDVDGDDQLHRCQYFDNEVVTLRSRPLAASPDFGSNIAERSS